MLLKKSNNVKEYFPRVVMDQLQGELLVTKLELGNQKLPPRLRDYHESTQTAVQLFLSPLHHKQ